MTRIPNETYAAAVCRGIYLNPSPRQVQVQVPCSSSPLRVGISGKTNKPVARFYLYNKPFRGAKVIAKNIKRRSSAR